MDKHDVAPFRHHVFQLHRGGDIFVIDTGDGSFPRTLFQQGVGNMTMFNRAKSFQFEDGRLLIAAVMHRSGAEPEELREMLASVRLGGEALK